MKIRNLSNKQLIFGIFVIAFIIRLIFVHISYKSNVMAGFSDDIYYMKYAEAVIDQSPFVLDNKPEIVEFVGPVLPWIMAIMIMVFGKSWLPIFILNAFISSLTCVSIFLLGKAIFNKKAGVLAGLWSIIYVLFIQYVATSGKEIWMIFLFTLIIYLVIHLGKRKKTILYTFLIAFIFSVLIHLDERYFAYFPLFFIFFILLDKINWKNGLKKASLFVIIVLILMVPWLIRNYYVYNRIVILTIRTTPLTDKIFGYETLPAISKSGLNLNKKSRWYINKAQIDSVVCLGSKITMKNGKLISKDQFEAMQEGILPKPFSQSQQYLSRFIELWEPVDFRKGYYQDGYRYDGKWSLKHNISVGLTYGLLLPFSLFGLIKIIFNETRLGIFFLSIFIIHTLIHVLFIPFTTERYRLPIDPFIILIGFYGIINLYNRFKSKDRKIYQ